MRAGELLAVLAGAGAATGGLLLWSGFRPREPRCEARWAGALRDTLARWARLVGRRRAVRGLAGIALALVALVAVGWPVLVAAGAIAGWTVPLPGDRVARRREEERGEALARWCEMLRDAAGSGGGTAEILSATALHAPTAVRGPARRAAARLETEPQDATLEDLARDLAHPTGDLLVTALMFVATGDRGQTARVLDDVAAAAHRHVELRRRAEAARARRRAPIRLGAFTVAGLLAGVAVVAPGYMASYGTVAGQMALGGTGLAWLMLSRWPSGGMPLAAAVMRR